MKSLSFLSITFFAIFLMASCGSEVPETEATNADSGEEKEHISLYATIMTLEEAESKWEENFGIGPIEAFTLPEEIDEDMAAKGLEVYSVNCTACHNVDMQIIGPSPRGILLKRTPSWVMNMILNPEEMLADDAIAKQLLVKFNNIPMANQGLSEDDVRAILEYFRTL